MEENFKQGLLEKQSDHVKTWNVRYVVVQKSKLLYWKSSEEYSSGAAPRGSFTLNPGTSIIAGKYSSGRFVFVLVLPALQLSLAAKSDEERTSWAKALIKASKGESPQTLTSRQSVADISVPTPDSSICAGSTGVERG